MHAQHRAIACVAALALSACAGSGEGLDENGRPIGSAAEPLLPQFASIQRNVFTPICTQCHAGASAPLGLRLEEGVAYAMLVNTPSVEVPALLRVAPGNPDASYLIHKIEGTAAVGGRMPLNLPPLPPATIATIRQWIVDGALPPSNASGTAGQTKAATLDAVWPLPGSTLADPPREILISASDELDTTLLGAGTVTLARSGGDADFTNGNEQTLDAALVVRSLQPTVVALTAPAGTWVADHYELRVSGTAPLALADRAARAIDGDRDGEPGGDFVLRFKVEQAR